MVRHTGEEGFMKEKVKDKNSKDVLAWGCVALSAIGLLLGIIFPAVIGGMFSIGTFLCFIGFLLSLGSVKDRGSNLPALIAFGFSYIAMSICIFISSLAA